MTLFVELPFSAYIIESIGFSERKGRGREGYRNDRRANAGKTRAAPAIIPHHLGIREFVNADEIARGLSPFNPDGVAIAAARLMLERMRGLVQAGESFAFETTCAGRAYVPWLQGCKTQGWRLTLLFLWLPTPQAAIDRVARRVRQGGHQIPTDVVNRRWKAGIANMRDFYLPLADMAAIYDNSDVGRILIAERTPEAPLVVYDAIRWAMIERVPA